MKVLMEILLEVLMKVLMEVLMAEKCLKEQQNRSGCGKSDSCQNHKAAELQSFQVEAECGECSILKF